jgi:hypothetical protein
LKLWQKAFKLIYNSCTNKINWYGFRLGRE